MLLFVSAASFSPLSRSLCRVGDLGEECFCGLLGCTVVPQCLSLSLPQWLCAVLCSVSLLSSKVLSCLETRSTALPPLSWEAGADPDWSNPTALDSLLSGTLWITKEAVRQCVPLVFIHSKNGPWLKDEGWSHISANVMWSRERFIFYILRVSVPQHVLPCFSSFNQIQAKMGSCFVSRTLDSRLVTKTLDTIIYSCLNISSAVTGLKELHPQVKIKL